MDKVLLSFDLVCFFLSYYDINYFLTTWVFFFNLEIMPAGWKGHVQILFVFDLHLSPKTFLQEVVFQLSK